MTVQRIPLQKVGIDVDLPYLRLNDLEVFDGAQLGLGAHLALVLALVPRLHSRQPANKSVSSLLLSTLFIYLETNNKQT